MTRHARRKQREGSSSVAAYPVGLCNPTHVREVPVPRSLTMLGLGQALLGGWLGVFRASQVTSTTKRVSGAAAPALALATRLPQRYLLRARCPRCAGTTCNDRLIPAHRTALSTQ